MERNLRRYNMRRIIAAVLSILVLAAFASCEADIVCPHDDFEYTAYFDAENHFPSKGICGLCGEEIVWDSIQIGTSDDLMLLGNDIKEGKDIGCYTISIIDDIDMSGKEWMSPKISGYDTYNGRDFVINGNGHAISSLSVTNEEEKEGLGFIGKIWSSATLEVNDLTLSAPTITAGVGGDEGPGVGGFIGVIDSSASVSFTNCHVIGGSINEGHWAGGIYGHASGYDKEGAVHTVVTIDGCTVEGITIKATDASVGGIMGHVGGNSNTEVNVLDSSVTGCTIENESSTMKSGNILGTNGVGDTTLTRVTFSGNTVKSGGVENNDGVYGRLAFSSDGSLTIDDNPVNEE